MRVSAEARQGPYFNDGSMRAGALTSQPPADHYTIRAGRNLPDKEFRYLRTVIVTAAVYRGFSSDLRTINGAEPSP